MAKMGQLMEFVDMGDEASKRVDELSTISEWMAGDRPAKLSPIVDKGRREVSLSALEAEEISDGFLLSEKIECSREFAWETRADYLCVETGKIDQQSPTGLLLSMCLTGKEAVYESDFVVTRYNKGKEFYDVFALSSDGKIKHGISSKIDLDGSLFPFFVEYDESAMQRLSEANEADTGYFWKLIHILSERIRENG